MIWSLIHLSGSGLCAHLFWFRFYVKLSNVDNIANLALGTRKNLLSSNAPFTRHWSIMKTCDTMNKIFTHSKGRGTKMCQYRHQCISFQSSIIPSSSTNPWQLTMHMEPNNEDKITGWSIGSQSPPLVHNIKTGCRGGKPASKLGEYWSFCSTPKLSCYVCYSWKVTLIHDPARKYIARKLTRSHHTSQRPAIAMHRVKSSNTGHSTPPPHPAALFLVPPFYFNTFQCFVTSLLKFQLKIGTSVKLQVVNACWSLQCNNLWAKYGPIMAPLWDIWLGVLNMAKWGMPEKDIYIFHQWFQ